MQTSIATVSLSGGLSEKLEAISAAKFDAVSGGGNRAAKPTEGFGPIRPSPCIWASKRD